MLGRILLGLCVGALLAPGRDLHALLFHAATPATAHTCGAGDHGDVPEACSDAPSHDHGGPCSSCAAGARTLAIPPQDAAFRAGLAPRVPAARPAPPLLPVRRVTAAGPRAPPTLL